MTSKPPIVDVTVTSAPTQLPYANTESGCTIVNTGTITVIIIPSEEPTNNAGAGSFMLIPGATMTWNNSNAWAYVASTSAGSLRVAAGQQTYSPNTSQATQDSNQDFTATCGISVANPFATPIPAAGDGVFNKLKGLSFFIDGEFTAGQVILQTSAEFMRIPVFFNGISTVYPWIDIAQGIVFSGPLDVNSNGLAGSGQATLFFVYTQIAVGGP